MPIESATYLSQLDAANPTSADPKSEGDNHLRLVKAALKATFPSFGASALNATQAQIDGVALSISVQAGTPAGFVVLNATGLGVGVAPSNARIHTLIPDAVRGTHAVFQQTGQSTFSILGEQGDADLGGSNGTLLSNSSGVIGLRNGTSGQAHVLIGAAGSLMVGVLADTGHTNSNGIYFSPSAAGGHAVTNHAAGVSSGAAYASFGYAGAAIGSITQAGTTGVSYNTSSDARLKVITGPVTASGAFIDSLKPKRGYWRADGSPFVGFVAHEFQEVSPSSVTGQKDAVDKDGHPVYMSMQASSPEVMANIVAELQDIRKRLLSLEAARA